MSLSLSLQMDCNKAEKFDFVSFLAIQSLAAFLHGMLSSPAIPVLGSNPTLILHQPILEAHFQRCRNLLASERKAS